MDSPLDEEELDAARPSIVARGLAVIALASLGGTLAVTVVALALARLGVPLWTVRREWGGSSDTFDLLAGGPMLANNVVLALASGALAWLVVHKAQVPLARAALVTLIVAALAGSAGLVLKWTGLHAIGATEFVLVYEVIAAALIGLALAVGLAAVAKR